MKALRPQPSLAQQVYDAIVDEICDGRLKAGAHLVQEHLAAQLGVSRQPVQQAMALLKADGMVEEIGARGLQVTALDPDLMRHHYDVRAALDGMAARLSASRARDVDGGAAEIETRGRDILRRGQAAVEGAELGDQIRCDVEFHTLFYESSDNPLLARSAEPHWRFLRRAMGEVLSKAELPEEIWQQHADILDAVIAGDPVRAEALMVEHALHAADALCAVLADQTEGNTPGS